MTGRLWIAALLVALSMACGESAAPAPPVPVQESVVVVPAAQNDPDALPYLVSLQLDPTTIYEFGEYRGVQSLESNILESDVIARVSYLRKQSSSVLRPDTSYYAWTAMLEFRFTVHEYLKGTGPAEIGGIVYMTFETETQARLAAARIGAAHDSRWDSREAIVFLYSPSVEDVPGGAALPTTSDQYLFGRMIELTTQKSGEAYSVASAHRKLWLPAAETPSQGASGAQGSAQTPDDKLFLLDAPAHAGASGAVPAHAGASGTVRVTLPTISQGSMKSKITALEAEANKGGTPEYRKCVEISYRYENNLRRRAELEGPFPHVRYTSDIGSGLPAGTLVRDIGDESAPSESEVGLSWFKGPDKDLVTDMNVDFTPYDGGTVRYRRRVVTTRPLPAGEYAPNPGGTWHGGVVCARYPAIADNYWVIEITVTAPAGTLHEAFFDPVAIGAAVGADGANGVLKPAAFTVGGASATITSLEWESGGVTMELDPSASLAGHAVDFIALDGSVSLTLSFDDATQSGGALTWSVAAQPWNAGDLLMLRIRSANVIITPPTATPTPNTPLPTATPPAVSNLVATASTMSVRLTWDDLDGATKYRVEHRLSTSTGSWTPVDTTANVRNVANLTPETSYAFRIRAYGDGTTYKAAWGAEAATTASTVGIVTLAKPPAPGGLSASSSGENSVSVSWTALTGADKYEVQYRQGSSGNWSTYKNDITGTSPTVSGLQCDTGYQFSVRAYGDDVTYRADWGAWATTTASTGLCKPPGPGGLSASAPGENSVSVSWTALTGADKYEVQYRQGSSGNWSTYKNDITGTSPTVSGLQCDTGYQFRVRAYGDGVTYRADWGAWSSASSDARTSTCPTPTPTPTPGSGGPSPAPSGTLSASPEKIAVGQTTTITATWNNVASTPKLSFGPQLAERCAGIQGQGVQGRSVLDTELVAKATQTLTGCTAGTVTVKLLDGSTELDAVTVAVVAKPSIQATRRIGYRWFNIGWTAARPYTSFAIEWRNEGEGESDWSELVQSGQSGARAIMSGMAAAIRGLPHEDKRIEIRVIARGSGGLEGRSDTLRYARDTQPAARGHLPDHTMRYRDTISSSGVNATLAGWIKPQLWSAASAWADLVPELDLEACSTTCARNEDKDIFWIEIDIDCNHRAACVKGLPAFNLGLELEGKIVGSGLRMVFVPEGTLLTAHKWTTDPSLDREDTLDGWRYYWVDRVVVHEFGHTFGLADRGEALGGNPHYDPNYRGIMGD